MIRAGYFAIALLSVVPLAAGAQTPIERGPCTSNKDACDVLSRDATDASSPGGIGSKKGTGGGGTNAIARPEGLGNSTVTIPPITRLPNLPRRFGF